MGTLNIEQSEQWEENGETREQCMDIKEDIRDLDNGNGIHNAAYQYMGLDDPTDDGIPSEPILLKAWSAGKRKNAISIYHGRRKDYMNSDRNKNIKSEYTIDIDKGVLETYEYDEQGNLLEKNQKKLVGFRIGERMSVGTENVLMNFRRRIAEARRYREAHMQDLARVESEKREKREMADSEENSDFLASVENGAIFEGDNTMS